jgi:hypothetical protein
MDDKDTNQNFANIGTHPEFTFLTSGQRDLNASPQFPLAVRAGLSVPFVRSE